MHATAAASIGISSEAALFFFLRLGRRMKKS
jgi:hypothetical protein